MLRAPTGGGIQRSAIISSQRSAFKPQVQRGQLPNRRRGWLCLPGRPWSMLPSASSAKLLEEQPISHNSQIPTVLANKRPSEYNRSFMIYGGPAPEKSGRSESSTGSGATEAPLPPPATYPAMDRFEDDDDADRSPRRGRQIGSTTRTTTTRARRRARTQSAASNKEMTP